MESTEEKDRPMKVHRILSETSNPVTEQELSDDFTVKQAAY